MASLAAQEPGRLGLYAATRPAGRARGEVLGGHTITGICHTSPSQAEDWGSVRFGAEKVRERQEQPAGLCCRGPGSSLAVGQLGAFPHVVPEDTAHSPAASPGSNADQVPQRQSQRPLSRHCGLTLEALQLWLFHLSLAPAAHTGPGGNQWSVAAA